MISHGSFLFAYIFVELGLMCKETFYLRLVSLSPPICAGHVGCLRVKPLGVLPLAGILDSSIIQLTPEFLRIDTILDKFIYFLDDMRLVIFVSDAKPACR